MSKSTPIDQLRREPDNSELVQNILNDMGGGSQQQMPSPSPSQQMQQQQQLQQQKKQVHFEDDVEGDSDEEGEGFENGDVDQRPLTLTEKIIRELRAPLLVMFLVFLTNYELFSKLITQYLPSFVSSVGDLGVLGVKALFAGIIYYIVVRYLF